MDDDGSSERDGGFEPLLEALLRAKREVSVAVGHGVEGVRNWVEERWLPIRLVALGGFSWTMSRTFGWFVGQLASLGSWLASSLAGTTVSTQILLFFTMYVLHSVTQTKLILGIKTKMERVNSDRDAKVRADGGSDEDFSSRIWGLGGIVVGAILGSSFGMDGAFVGAGVGWGLGDELDRRLEAKVNEASQVPREGQKHVEKQ